MRALLALLEQTRVRYVLVGSVAAMVHGVDLTPADLDVAPNTDSANLAQLIGALREMEAQPRGPFGDWVTLANGERKWIARHTTEEDLAAWTPDAGDPHSLDHLYVTRLGDFDVVPEIAGRYEVLLPRAARREWSGINVTVAHVDDLIARLTVSRREKDIARIAALRAIQRPPR